MQWRGKTTWLVALGFLLWWLFGLESKLPNVVGWAGHAPIDFKIYYLAGQEISAGKDLYDAPFIGNLPFTYPPFSAALFMLFIKLPVLAASSLWQLLSFLALLAVVLAVIAERKIQITPPVVLIALGLSFASIVLDAVKGTFFFGQINLFLMLLVTVDLLPTKRPWAGVGVGLAAGIKLTPAFFGLNFLIERNWRAAALSIVTFLFTVGVGFYYVADAKRFWVESVFQSERIGVETNSGAQAIKALLFREFGHATTPLWIALVALVMISCIFGLIRSLKLGNKSFAMVLSGITAVLISPFSWFHHWVWLIPLCVCIACFFNEKCEKLRISRQWNGVGGWLLSQLGAVVAMATIALLMIPYLSKYVMLSFGWAHPETSDLLIWRESWLFEGMAIVVAYGLYSLVMTIVSWPKRRADGGEAGVEQEETEGNEMGLARPIGQHA